MTIDIISSNLAVVLAVVLACGQFNWINEK